jgi:malate dehydrogenase (oxaloacetate-decarboxylating)(NADP+)
VLVFPDLTSGNIAYKLMNRLAGATIVGPLLMGIDRPFNVLQRNTDVESVVDLIAITAVQAQLHDTKPDSHQRRESLRETANPGLT